MTDGARSAPTTRLITAKIQRETKPRETGPRLATKTEEMQQVLTFFTAEMMAAHEELMKRARALEEANHRLEEIDTLKTRLLGEVAHELRSPLAGILLKLDLLERGKPELRQQYIDDVRQQVRRLGHMIENILDMTRIYMTNPAERFTSVDLHALLFGVVERNALSARARNLDLSMQRADAPAYVRGERDQLERVFENLVNNAIKYTRQGSVRVRVSVDSAKQVVGICVQDTGIGIAREDIPHLFDRFHRGRLGAAAGIPGTGLGLAIVKDIVDVHGGRIEVMSEPGRGSRFCVYLSTVPAP